MGPHVAFMSGLVGVKSIFQGDSKQAMQVHMVYTSLELPKNTP